MMDLVRSLLSLERSVGPLLVRVVYFTGLLGIGLFMLTTVLVGLMALGADIVRGLVQILGALAVGAVLLVYWRFVCEIFMLAFKTYERLGEIRDALGARKSAGGDFSQF